MRDADPDRDPLARAIAASGRGGGAFDGRAPYFREPLREKRLKLILHLLSYGEVLVVRGAVGSGRSRLLRQIRDEARQDWRVCLVEGSPVVSHDVLESVLVDGFGIDPDARDPDLPLVLRRTLVDLRRTHVIPVCLVDDADRLPASALDLLAGLHRDDEGGIGPGLLLVVEDSTSTLPADLQERIGHVFEWPGFNQQGTRDYVFHCLRSAGEKEGPPFTAAALRLIHASSEGLPGRIEPLARRLLVGGRARRGGGTASTVVEPPTAGGADGPPAMAPRREASRTAAGRWVRRLAMASVVGLLGLIWWQQDRINALFGQGAMESRPANRSEAEAERRRVPAGERGVVAPAGAAAVPDDRPSAGTSGSVMDGTGWPEQPPAEDSDVAPVVAGATAPVRDGSEPATVSDGGDEGALAVAASPPASAVTPVTVTRAFDDADAAAGATTVSPVGDRGVVHEDVGRTPMEPYEAWLSSRPPEHFTLQLLALEPAQARRYVVEHGLADEAVLLPRRSPDGRTLLAIVHGDFADGEAARREVERLRRRMPGLEPWLRRFSDIQAELGRRP